MTDIYLHFLDIPMATIDRYISLEEFHNDAQKLASQIEKGKYDLILCVTWGGMALSYYISKALDLPKVTNINFKSYDAQTHIQWKSIFIDGPWPLDISDKNVLIVDDLIDKGASLNEIMNIYLDSHDEDKALDVAVLYTKKDHKFNKPDKTKLYATQHDIPREWIQFHYEKPFE